MGDRNGPEHATSPIALSYFQKSVMAYQISFNSGFINELLAVIALKIAR